MKKIEDLPSDVKLYFTDIETRVTYMISEASLTSFRGFIEATIPSLQGGGGLFDLTDSDLVDYYIDLHIISLSRFRPIDHG